MRKTIIIRENFDKLSDSGEYVKMWNEPSGEGGVRKKHLSISYQRWCNIKARTCNDDGYLESRPHYVNCKNEFNGFGEFAEWSSEEVGYLSTDIVGGKQKHWHLDKDLICRRSAKSYSPSTCIFVPQEVNMFTCVRQSARGECPLGVIWHKRDKKFMAQASFGGVNRYLGLFSNSHDAHIAWQKSKISYGKELAGRFYISHRKLSDALMGWVSDIESDVSSGNETIIL